MKINDIIKRLEVDFPRELACSWDNVGLLIGDRQRDVSKVVVCLDVTQKVIEMAKNVGAELIVAHHPVIFSPISYINGDTKNGKLLLDIIENKIAVYAAHTNCDKAESGINARLAEMFELTCVEPLEEDGLGKIGILKEAVAFCDFAKTVEEKLGTKIRFSGDIKKSVNRVAICSGAGSDTLPTAILKGADVMITGDMKYHQMLDFADEINVIDAGHYPTEIMVTDIFEKILCPLNVEVIKAESQDVFKYL